MKLKPAEPLLLTKLGCPLAFDVIDADNVDMGIIGRATYKRWFEAQGAIEYSVRVQIGDRCLLGSFVIQHPSKL